MEEDDDDDEWRPQQFYLDVISGACEPIGGGHFWWGVGIGGEMIGIMCVCVCCCRSCRYVLDMARVRHIVPDPFDDNLRLVIFSDLLYVERERERKTFSKFCEY